MTLRRCEAATALEAMGIAPDLARCGQVGEVFVRDAHGYGHWVCSEHRRAFRLAGDKVEVAR